MKQFFFYLATLLFIIASSPRYTSAQFIIERTETNLHYEKLQLTYKSYSNTDVDNAVDKLKLIQSENVEVKDKWVGEYVMFGSLDFYSFRWSPKVGFVETAVYTCIPELTSLNYGSIMATSDYVQATSNATQPKVKNIKYLRVKWGEQRYLIQEDRIARFYSYLAGYNDDGTDYIDQAFFWVHKDDVDKPNLGMPIFPAGYERFVKKPIEAKVTKVLKKEIKPAEINEDLSMRDVNGKNIPEYESHTFVELNAGSTSGVKRGMGFSPIDLDFIGLRLKIISVDKYSSKGVLILQLGEDKQERESDLELIQTFSAGAKLSTSTIIY